MRYNEQEEKLHLKLKEVVSKRLTISPVKEALYITVWYILLGSIWILFSDTIVNMLVKDPETVKTIQLIKGWLYVIITGVYIFTLIYYRVRLLQGAAEKIHDGYSDITAMSEELLEKEDEIFELSHYDRMSGLLNWLGLSVAFEQLLEHSKHEKHVLYYIDIDNIKHINDTLGHENGNLLLYKIGTKLKKLCENEGIISRVSGDEFVLVLPYDGDYNKLQKTATMINKLVKTTWKFDRYEFFVTASLGLAIYPDHGDSLDILLKHSDLAMFIAKDKGKNQHYTFNETLSQKNQNYIEVISEIRHGIAKNEFELYYQPIVNLGSGNLMAVEALIRWNHPKKGLVTPFHFIEIAEESGQINEIGRWVFKTACEQHKTWIDQGFDPLKISINLSGKRLFDDSLLSEIKSVLEENQIQDHMIQIEITETAVMENLDSAINILEDIRKLKIYIALDDFGTGYSSLTYLQAFPIDVLKIDKEFINNISVKGMEKENSIINAVIKLAHTLGLKIVAEGIETSEQAEYLMINDCDFGQGYYYDRPMKASAIEAKYFKK